MRECEYVIFDFYDTINRTMPPAIIHQSLFSREKNYETFRLSNDHPTA
jgi:hypothetical protein